MKESILRLHKRPKFPYAKFEQIFRRFKFLFWISFFGLGIPICTFAQLPEEPCANEIYAADCMTEANYQTLSEQCNLLYEQVLLQQFVLPNEEYLIPCVVHVFYDNISLEVGEDTDKENLSDCVVQRAILTLNYYLRGLSPNGEIIGENTHIQVALAAIDPNGNLTSGIEHISVASSCYGIGAPGSCISVTSMNTYQWNTSAYLNINVVDFLYGALGFGALYTPLFLGDEQIDNCDSGQQIESSKTLVHEFGHYLNLGHLNQSSGGSNCHNPAICASFGDEVCDTEMIISQYPPNTTWNNEASDCVLEMGFWPKRNFMTYAHKTSSTFSFGQITRMQAALNASGGLNLWSESNLLATGVSVPTTVSCCPIEISLINLINPSSCSSNGSIEISALNAVSPITYKWYNNNNGTIAGSTLIQNLTAGTYQVHVCDANGCSTWAIFELEGAVPPILGGNIDFVTCQGTGTLCPDITSGIGPFTLSWANVFGTVLQTNYCAVNLNVGWYTLTITDANGCTATSPWYQVSVQPGFTLFDASVVNFNNATCVLNCDGSATVSASGGVAPYSYDWDTDGLDDGSSLSNLCSSTYNVAVSDATGCTDALNINIGATIGIFAYADNDEDGYGSGPQIQLCALQIGYVLLLGDCNDTNPSINPSATEICNGIDDDCDGSADEGFDTDNDGYTTCNGDCNDTTASIYPAAIEICNGMDDDCDGSIDESFDTDNDGYTACNGDCNDTNASINPAAAESCNGFDDDCDGSTDESFDTDNDGYTTCNGDCNDTNAAINPVETETCNGFDDDCDGSIDEGFDTDNDGYTTCNGDCNDSNASINPDALEVFNQLDDDCDGDIDEGTIPLSISFSTITNVTCNGFNDGTATAIGIGGTEPYNYLWSNGDTDANAENLSAGAYACTVTDANGMTVVASVTIEEAPAISYNLNTPIGLSCLAENDLNYLAFIQGGELPFEVADGGNLTIQIFDDGISTTLIIGDASPTAFSVVIEDAFGCAITVTTMDIVAVATSVEIEGNLGVCIGESTTLTAIPVSFNYSVIDWLWDGFDDGDTEELGAEPGTHTILMIDQLGCTATATVEVLESQIDLTVIQTSNTCFGICEATATSTVTGAISDYEVTWPLGADENALCEGTYEVTVIEEIGCEAQFTITIVQSSEIAISQQSSTPTSCPDAEDGTLDITVTGGSEPYTYTWSNALPNTQDQSDLAAGTYQVTGTDDNDCSVSQTFTVGATPWDYPADVTVFSQVQLDALFSGGNTTSFGGDITISGGGTYLLQDKIFVLATGSEIYINQPASIEFRNCDFVPCGGWWNGFRVKSDPGNDDNAFNDVRGVLILSENSNGGCYIEGAGSAIETGGTWGQNGIHKSSGRIQSTKAHFYNCLNSFDIRNGIDKGSFFKGCTFDVNTDLQIKFPGSNFSRHMYYSRTFGYHVYGCTFTNSNQLVNSWGDRRYGIYAYNSPVRVSGWDIDLNGEIQAQERSTFEGFNCGFRAYVNNGTYNGLVVKDSEFHQNKYAIYCNNACFHYLDRNEIHVGEPTGLAPLDNATGAYAGIYQYGGAQFEIMENDITGYITTEPDLTGPSSAFSVGICISRTKTADDEVYKNYLHNLNFGNLANGDNNEGDAQNGLRYVCNENTGNHYDFAVSDNIILASVADIAEVQTDFATDTWETTEKSAANKFFSTADDANIQYQNFWNVGETETTEYRRYILGANETPTTGDYLGIEITQSGPNQCASETHKLVLVDGSIDQVELNNWNSRKELSRTNWQSSLYLWKALIDGGNTEQLQSQIDFAWTQDTWTMRSQLLAKSPYLSREILYGVADKTLVFPHPIALEIFLANPDVLRDNRFIKHLQTKADPMPEYMIDLLLASRDQATFRTMLENNLGKHRSIYMEAAGKVLRTHLQDENYDITLFPNELKTLKTFNTELLVVEDYLQHNNNTEARHRYDEIPATCEFTRYEMAEWEAFGLWLDVRESMVLYGKEYDALSTAEVSTLTNLAEIHWNSYAGRYAQEILNEYYAGDYEIEPMVSMGSGNPKSLHISPNDVKSLMNVYPNPTSDYLIVQLSLSTFIGRHQLVIADATGKQVYQAAITNAQQQLAIDVQQWSSGTYHVTVMNEQKVIETKEINVVH